VNVIGDYTSSGYAHLEGLVPPEVAGAFLDRFKQDIGPAPVPLSRVREHPNLLQRPALEVYGHHYYPMLFFLWASRRS
jgi:hypothetical protein